MLLDDSNKLKEAFNNESIIRNPFSKCNTQKPVEAHYYMFSPKLEKNLLIRVVADVPNDMIAYNVYEYRNTERPGFAGNSWSHGSSFEEIFLIIRQIADRYIMSFANINDSLSEISTVIYNELIKC